LEALRLADLEGRYQEKAAEQMGVSRSTFQRIVTELAARSPALVEEPPLHIEGALFVWRLSAGTVTTAVTTGD